MLMVLVVKNMETTHRKAFSRSGNTERRGEVKESGMEKNMDFYVCNTS